MITDKNQTHGKENIVLSSARIGTGIDRNERKEVAKGLSHVLADSFVLYTKTLNYHWNVTGRSFKSLHSLFEEQYRDLAEANDVIAERIRALGAFAPGSMKQFAELSDIKEQLDIPTADSMVKHLIEDNERLVERARKLMPIATEDHDDVTADLLVNRMKVHEKNAWMLRSILE